MDFKNYRFRASQAHILMTGTIGLTEIQKAKMEDYIARKKASESGELIDGKPVKPLTQNMEEDLKNLLLVHESQDLPKTIISELKKIYRAEKYNRNFVWTNKYVQKGILQEEEAITLYQEYRKKILGINTFFTKNTERISNDYFTGEWDLPTLPEIKKTKEGFDIKNSWSLDTFPFEDEELSTNDFWQNQV